MYPVNFLELHKGIFQNYITLAPLEWDWCQPHGGLHCHTPTFMGDINILLGYSKKILAKIATGGTIIKVLPSKGHRNVGNVCCA